MRVGRRPIRGVWASCLLAMAVICLAAACTRPLTQSERRFAADVIGPSLNAQEVRLTRGLGLSSPERQPERAAKLLPVARPPIEGLCDRDAPEPQDGPPPAFALWNRIHIAEEFYRPEMAPDWPRAALFPEALILAHELVHVWQWQNRARTGYSPARAGFESWASRDPYFYKPEAELRYADFGYEQQASLLEDYLCYGLYDPANPRRAELRRILVPHFPLDRLDTALGQ